jgi:hypothetical protein
LIILFSLEEESCFGLPGFDVHGYQLATILGEWIEGCAEPRADQFFPPGALTMQSIFKKPKSV